MEWVFWGLAAVCAGLVFFLLKIATAIWWKPLQVKKYFEAQGIRGPPYRLFYGNITDVSRMIHHQKSKPMPLSHDILPRVLPHLHQWTKTYGQDFIFWFGSQARLVVPHPELIKRRYCPLNLATIQRYQITPFLDNWLDKDLWD